MSAPAAPTQLPGEPARLRPEQRRVFASAGWMRCEAARRFEEWLLVQAILLCGSNLRRARSIVDHVLKRLVLLDVTRFGDADREYLECELRAQLTLAMNPRPRRRATRRSPKEGR